ncbi:aerobic C4-dicarboxylate transport protein [Filimonas zeae]|uniref:C4-dicarboxylate ABC transporter n=1 Tax=Filimonas zeae TaxID=1737353 RepID=A0A917J1X3_9BACT|nr:C4-dicarboxylate transporter DctA [Filimonas zeae]MDR6340051.1 aerobic C4-dicarboxylate transport protein [Filimonas zeae]GGH70902.1 C4-dicarboxylate ABC transporter [Filimonas zeae]
MIKTIFSHLTVQVIIAILAGIACGFFFPGFAPYAKLLSSTFINMISMLIVPVIFFTIVLGIARMSDVKKVGRVGGKAILYFEVVTTIAIIIGLVTANLMQPGKGVVPTTGGKTIPGIATAEKINWAEFLTHIVPHNVFESFTKGDILQILFFAILFGFGVSKLGSTGASLIATFEKIAQVLFNMMKVVMKVAPIGAFGGMAYTIGTYGLHTLLPMGKIMLTVYLTCIFFIFGVLNAICRYYRFSLWQYLKFIREEILVVLGTSSSESVLPAMISKMEKFGCSRSVVGLVIPTGYSFNLDGTSIYLAVALVFLTQVFQVPMGFEQQLTAMAVLMVMSKGAAGVTGSGFIVLSSTLSAMHIMPVENVAILLGVDRFMSEARAITNMIGNGIAAVVIAKSENEFDGQAYQLAIAGDKKDLLLHESETRQ